MIHQRNLRRLQRNCLLVYPFCSSSSIHLTSSSILLTSSLLPGDSSLAAESGVSASFSWMLARDAVSFCDEASALFSEDEHTDVEDNEDMESSEDL